MNKLSFKQEQQILENLSENLKQEVLSEKNKKTLNQCTLFKKYFSNRTIKKIGPFVQTLIVKPNEVVFSYKEQPEDDEMYIYFLQKGKIDFKMDLNKERIVYSLKTGYFGEKGFFFGQVNFNDIFFS